MTALDAYKFSFGKIMYTGHIQDYVMKLMKRGYTDSFIREVFLEMGANGVTEPNLKYMQKLAEDWISRGIASRKDADQKKTSNSSTPSNVTPFTPRVSKAEELRRRAREEEALEKG